MNINELAKISGVSVRTLHHYDRIRLLCPARDPDNDYRVYGEREVDRLQQILLFRACGFPLKAIGELLDSPDFDREKAFCLQKKALIFEQKRISGMLATLERSIDTLKGRDTMTDKEKFQGFDFSSNPYEQEARQRWGDEAVEKSNRKLGAMSASEKQKMGDTMNGLFQKLGGLRHEAPESAEVQAAVGELYTFFNGGFGIHYTPEAFAGLGQMYVDDERFTKNIDRFGEGLSVFLRDAMGVYAQSVK